MADTPILNYKGKYDGPEIDKAVELALDLENPKSCPYYVHVSLSQPDYVLTVGLGDAEGNPFNYAEIDLPLESMVVNATYSNGNIILHLQDGTTTEPIPISALIAGLVSETRTIAGIDLKDDITQKELRDALDVYTKDSVDQLVTDLENTINETLNEMKQSLDDLSELTSEHDTQIKKNASDISINKNDIVINRVTLGTQRKNLLSVNDGTATRLIEEFINRIEPGKYILSIGELTSTDTDSSICNCFFTDNYNTQLSNQILLKRGTDISATVTINEPVTKIRIYSSNSWTNSEGDTVTASNIMLRPADITDSTYEPYKPSVNERLVDIEESVSELTPQVEQNKSDILKVQRHSATMGMYSQGWYRIAECVIGQGRSAILRLERTYGNNPPEIITLLINVAYNVASAPFFDCNILDKYVQKSLLKKLRIVIPTELSLSSKMYIDIWNDDTSANSLKTTIFGESVLSSSNEPITILNPTIAPELTGEYTTKQFDLTEGDVFDRLKNLKDLLSKLHGAVSYPVTANGSFTAAGATENITNRIRTDIIPVKAGDVIEIINGSLVHGCGIWKGTVNSTNIIRNDSSPKNTNENVIIEYDGNIVITFLRSNNENISLSDFDGSVTLYRKST